MSHDTTQVRFDQPEGALQVADAPPQQSNGAAPPDTIRE